MARRVRAIQRGAPKTRFCDRSAERTALNALLWIERNHYSIAIKGAMNEPFILQYSTEEGRMLWSQATTLLLQKLPNTTRDGVGH